jgi:YHS domain-containing protein
MNTQYPRKERIGFFFSICPVLGLIILIFAGSCHNQPSSRPDLATKAIKSTDSVKFTLAMVDNKKDPSCGMPLTAGIGDTVHYNGKVYGFCSDECKQIFLKKADSLSKTAEMK